MYLYPTVSELSGFEYIIKEQNESIQTENEALKARPELETQVSRNVTELVKLQNQLAAEATEFRHQRNMALDERDEHLQVIQRRNAAIDRTKLDLDTFTKQLEEKRFEQERSLMNSQIESLTGVFIKSEVINHIIEKICMIPPRQVEEIPGLDSCCSMAAHFCSVVYTESLLLSYGDKLLLTLLKLSLKMPKETKYLSWGTLEECRSPWRDSLATILRSNLSKDVKFNLLDKMAEIVEEEFLSADLGDGSPDHGHCGHLARIQLTLIDLLKAAYAGLPLCMTAVVDVIFYRKKLVEYGEGTRMLCQVMDYVNVGLCCPGNELKFHDSLTEHDIYLGPSFGSI